MEIFFIKALQLILCFALLILLHEGGHFFFAKLFKVRVEKFCLSLIHGSHGKFSVGKELTIISVGSP